MLLLEITTICSYTLIVKIEWDEHKRQSNLLKHGFDFVDAQHVFAGEVMTLEDKRQNYGETRYITLGILRGVVVIVHTETANSIRMISMRKATKNETRLYYDYI